MQTRCKFESTRRDDRWLSVEAMNTKRVRRRLERKYKSTCCDTDYVAYLRACRVANKAIKAARCDFNSKQVKAAQQDPRRRWSAIRNALHLTDRAEILPSDECRCLCDGSAAFFVNRIMTVKAAIRARLHYQDIYPLNQDLPHAGLPITTLSPPSIDEVTKLINSDQFNAGEVISSRRHTDINNQVVRLHLRAADNSPSIAVI